MSAGVARSEWLGVMLLLLSAAVVTGCARDSTANPGVPAAYVAAARGWVAVEGGLRTVRAPYDGRIDEVRVREGDTVQAGQVLLSFDEGPLAARLASGRAELARARAQADLQRVRLPAARRDAADLDEAAKAGAQAVAVADRARAAVAGIQAEMRAADATVDVARQNVLALQRDYDERVVHSPVAGTIVRSTVHPGDRVTAGSSDGLLEVLPGGRRVVRAELGEDDLAAVQVGSRADVSLAAGTGQAYPARVLRIAALLGATTPDEGAADPVDRLAAECILEVEGLPFLVGQRVVVMFRRADQRR
ncbi:MAG: HlyD family efflux transporter periplasmic adaptor subunit [Gammaproteobacteria bacterium]